MLATNLKLEWLNAHDLAPLAAGWRSAVALATVVAQPTAGHLVCSGSGQLQQAAATVACSYFFSGTNGTSAAAAMARAGYGVGAAAVSPTIGSDSFSYSLSDAATGRRFALVDVSLAIASSLRALPLAARGLSSSPVFLLQLQYADSLAGRPRPTFFVASLPSPGSLRQLAGFNASSGAPIDGALVEAGAAVADPQGRLLYSPAPGVFSLPRVDLRGQPLAGVAAPDGFSFFACAAAGTQCSSVAAATVDVVHAALQPLLSVPSRPTPAPVLSRTPVLGVSVSDPAGGDLETYAVTLACEQGFVSLGCLSQLQFSMGDGTEDATSAFRGLPSAVNCSLSALVYQAIRSVDDACTLTVTAVPSSLQAAPNSSSSAGMPFAQATLRMAVVSAPSGAGAAGSPTAAAPSVGIATLAFLPAGPLGIAVLVGMAVGAVLLAVGGWLAYRRCRVGDKAGAEQAEGDSGKMPREKRRRAYEADAEEGVPAAERWDQSRKEDGAEEDEDDDRGYEKRGSVRIAGVWIGEADSRHPKRASLLGNAPRSHQRAPKPALKPAHRPAAKHSRNAPQPRFLPAPAEATLRAMHAPRPAQLLLGWSGRDGDGRVENRI